MASKEYKTSSKIPTKEKSSSILGDLKSINVDNQSISLSLYLCGYPGLGDWLFLILFNGQTLKETKWQHQFCIELEDLPINVKEPYYQTLIADQPLILILRALTSRAAKDLDPLLNADNKAGASLDMLPLLLGEREIFATVPLISVNTGMTMNCQVKVTAKLNSFSSVFPLDEIPLLVTMMSAHCLPPVKEGTTFVSAMELTDVYRLPAINFGMSLSDSKATKVLWASASHGGHTARTLYNIPHEDKYIPNDVNCVSNNNCMSVYWNSMKRILIDPASLRRRLKSHFVLEVAGIPRQGKIDVRGHYLAFIDAGVLLEAGQYGVTICAKLLPYNEPNLPQNVNALLELPPVSAKTSGREVNSVMDDYGHTPYVVVRFDMCEPITQKAKILSFFDTIGITLKGPMSPTFELNHTVVVQENEVIESRCLRKEAGALFVHKELNCLAVKSKMQINQTMKHKSANRLLLRIRNILKQFQAENSNNWQEVVRAQHNASRRAVLASFAPQPPPPKVSSRYSATRSRLAGYNEIANKIVENNLLVTSDHPRVFLYKTLRSLESRNETDARDYLLQALNLQPRNRYLLWILGGIDFDKFERTKIANAAFRIAVKGDVSDGITRTIGWAALHALTHFWQNNYAAFVAAKKMRKYFEIQRDWKTFLERWMEISGEEEFLWNPFIISTHDPLLISSAFFLCLRCYNFGERLLQCFQNGCSIRGSRNYMTLNITTDIYYLRAASILIRQHLKDALHLIEQGINKYGPSAMMSQMRAICLVCLHGWNSECENAIIEADRAGAEPSSFLLLQAARGKLEIEPQVSLQYAARAHKNRPSAHIALLIGHIYAKLGDEYLALRWTTAAVNIEPLLADGWAFLAILALYERDISQARLMLRTSKQVGCLSLNMQNGLKRIMKAVAIETLPDNLMKDICFCEHK